MSFGRVTIPGYCLNDLLYHINRGSINKHSLITISCSPSSNGFDDLFEVTVKTSGKSMSAAMVVPLEMLEDLNHE